MAAPIIFDLLRTETPNPRQQDFFCATAGHIAYGGARGGGKSWAMRRKFVMLAMRYAGLKLLLLRRTLPELRENHLLPLTAELYNYARYNSDERAFTLPNGSRIRLGYCDSEADVYQYQGQEYDVIGLEEATHFTEAQRTFLTTANRSVRNDFSPRMYYSANPGGVGHTWFKRLFIDRQYTEDEDPNDYVFIPASVYDNTVLMTNNPKYVKALEALPEDMRRAHLLGDWNVFAGQYFREFDRHIHVVRPFKIPPDWRRYLTIDYGLDMLAAYWIAVDHQNKAYVYREVYRPNLIISDAANIIRDNMRGDDMYAMLAPPDLFNRRQETGRSAIEIFSEHGLTFDKTSNDRVQGWYDLKEWLKPYEDETHITADNPKGLTAKLVIFDTCPNLIRTLPLLQHDEKNPNDVANDPHELTHGPDALRGFVIGRPIAADQPRLSKVQWEDDQWDDYWAATPELQDRMIQIWGNPF